MGEFSPWHLLIVAAVFVLLFGAKKLPDAARSLGKSARIFKTEVKGLHEEETPADPATQAAPAQLPAAPGEPATPVAAPATAEAPPAPAQPAAVGGDTTATS